MSYTEKQLEQNAQVVTLGQRFGAGIEEIVTALQKDDDRQIVIERLRVFKHDMNNALIRLLLDIYGGSEND